MKLETFFEKFDELADTPDGVKKMRELVLRLATTGHLIPTDGSGWAKVALNEIASARMGKTILKNELSDSGIPVYSAGRENTAWGFITASDLTFRTGTIVVSARGTIGFPKIPAEPEFISTQTTIAITPTSEEIDSGYFCLQLQTVDWDDLTAKTAIPMITVKQVHAIEVRYPHSFAEQKRIVAKVDELMALCDRLESQQQERETRHAALARASLARFADAPTPANLPFLFHPSYAIPPAELRKSILTLAVQGKLVPQDPNDEPAEELFKKIQKHDVNRSSLLKRNSSIVEPAEFHHDIPEHWQWCELQEISDFVNGKAHEQFVTDEPGFALVNSRSVSNSGRIFKYSTKQLTPLFRGDIALVMSDVPDGRALARCFVIDEDDKYTLNQRIGCIRTSDLLCKAYLALVLDRNAYFLQYDDGKKQTNLKKIQIVSCPVPLPPLAEQRRIVAKVEQLMALVDALETQLAASRATAANLLSALVAELTRV
jgi:type I restriction enzyme S subunit